MPSQPPRHSIPKLSEVKSSRNQAERAQYRECGPEANSINHFLYHGYEYCGQKAADHVKRRLGSGWGFLIDVYYEGVVHLPAGQSKFQVSIVWVRNPR